MGDEARLYWNLIEFVGGGLLATLPLIVTAVVVLLALKAGKATYTRRGTLVMKYGIAYRVLTPLAAILGPLLLWMGVGFHRGVLSSENPQIPAILCGVLGSVFCLAAGPLILEVYRRKVFVGDEGIATQGWFKTTGPLAWDDVREVTFSTTHRQYTLRGKRATIKVPLALTGRDEFVEMCLERLPKPHKKVFKEHGSRMFGGM